MLRHQVGLDGSSAMNEVRVIGGYDICSHRSIFIVL
jgi:hypothetical protein